MVTQPSGGIYHPISTPNELVVPRSMSRLTAMVALTASLPKLAPAEMSEGLLAAPIMRCSFR